MTDFRSCKIHRVMMREHDFSLKSLFENEDFQNDSLHRLRTLVRLRMTLVTAQNSIVAHLLPLMINDDASFFLDEDSCPEPIRSTLGDTCVRGEL